MITNRKTQCCSCHRETVAHNVDNRVPSGAAMRYLDAHDRVWCGLCAMFAMSLANPEDVWKQVRVGPILEGSRND